MHPLGQLMFSVSQLRNENGTLFGSSSKDFYRCNAVDKDCWKEIILGFAPISKTIEAAELVGTDSLVAPHERLL